MDIVNKYLQHLPLAVVSALNYIFFIFLYNDLYSYYEQTVGSSLNFILAHFFFALSLSNVPSSHK